MIPAGHGQGRDQSRPGAGSLLGGLLLLIAVLGAGGWVAGAERDADHRFREFVVTGSVGHPVATTALTATLLEASTAARVAANPGAGRDTGGVWVVVLLRLEAFDEPASLSYVAVQDRQGRTWLGTERIDQPLTGYKFQPGIPVQGQVVFEVPREVVTELTLRLASGDAGADLSLRTVAEIALPIDEATVTATSGDEEPLLLDVPEVVVVPAVGSEPAPEAP